MGYPRLFGLAVFLAALGALLMAYEVFPTATTTFAIAALAGLVALFWATGSAKN